MFTSVTDILASSRTDGDYHTHVSMIQPLGKFNIHKDRLESFWQHYCTDIMNGNYSYGIAEKPQAYIPVLGDIDIKIKLNDHSDSLQRLYTPEDLMLLVTTYQNTIRTIVHNCSAKHLMCFVLEKEPYVLQSGDSYYLKSGLHIHFPFTFISKADHEAHFTPRLKRALDYTSLFKGLGYAKPSDVIDGCYTRNPWLMYGSKKSESMQPYVLTRIISEDNAELKVEEALHGAVIYDSEETPITIDGDYQFFLPRVLSIVCMYRDVCELKPGLTSLIEINGKNVKQIRREFKMVNLSENLKRCKQFLDIISEERAAIYSDWIHIGWALYNISNGNETGLQLWLEFSARCPDKFDEAGCIMTWEKMERRNMTMGTLAYYAKHDNMVAYNKLIDGNVTQNVKAAIEGGHVDIAKACYEKFHTEFVCASITAKMWFQFENHRWRKIDAGVFLRKRLSEDFVEKLSEIATDLCVKACHTDNSGEKTMYDIEQKKAKKLIAALKNTGFKSACLVECQEVFYKEDFLNNLNKIPHLFCFKNGVYDLKANVFRPGVPEDYLSKQSPTMYVDYDADDPAVVQVHDLFCKVFPDSELREYFLDVYSDVFLAGNTRKEFYFWIGDGNNSKSILELFFEKMLGGDYAVKLPTSLLFGKRTQSSGACPELIRAGNGVRWVVIQESDRKDVLNAGVFKELSSGCDTMYARDLYKGADDTKELEFQAKIQIIANDAPNMTGCDQAVWNRVRVIPFESTFTDNAPATFEEQMLLKRFPKDRNFADKIPSLLSAFAWYLLNHRKKPRRFCEPEKVKVANEYYRKKNDIYKQYIEECIFEYPDNPRATISVTELYNTFVEWYRESFSGRTAPDKMEIKDHFIKIWGQPDHGVWKNRKYMTPADAEKNGDAIRVQLVPSNSST